MAVAIVLLVLLSMGLRFVNFSDELLCAHLGKIHAAPPKIGITLSYYGPIGQETFTALQLTPIMKSRHPCRKRMIGFVLLVPSECLHRTYIEVECINKHTAIVNIYLVVACRRGNHSTPGVDADPARF